MVAPDCDSVQVGVPLQEQSYALVVLGLQASTNQAPTAGLSHTVALEQELLTEPEPHVLLVEHDTEKALEGSPRTEGKDLGEPTPDGSALDVASSAARPDSPQPVTEVGHVGKVVKTAAEEDACCVFKRQVSGF